MSSYPQVQITTTVIRGAIGKNNAKKIKEKLLDISCCDEDWNGNNGLEFVDEEAQEKGYESNQEYYADYVLEDEELEDKAHIERIFETYLDYWLGNDSYYVGYETMYNWIGKTLVVSVAYMWSV